MTALKLRVVDKGQEGEWDLATRLELGRQNALPGGRLESGPLTLLSLPDGTRRLVIGWNSEADELASRQVLLEPRSDGRVLVKNLSERLPLVASDLPEPLRVHESAVLTPPFTLTLGKRKTAHVFAAETDLGRPQTLRKTTLAPGAVAPSNQER